MPLDPDLPQTLGHEDDTALVWPGGSITWATLERRLTRIANGLAAAGLGPGDRIVVMAGNLPQYVELIVGCMRAEVMMVPVNWHLAVPEAAYILSDCGASMAFADVGNAATLRQAADRAGIASVLVFGEDYEAWRDAQPGSEPENALAGGPMFYTSGTTGRPKGVWRPTYRIPVRQTWENWFGPARCGASRDRACIWWRRRSTTRPHRPTRWCCRLMRRAKSRHLIGHSPDCP
jgi:acyl-CoA synthetase (AMP-forming)/AMP-acid ligase II